MKFSKFSFSTVPAFLFGVLWFMGASASTYTTVVWLKTGKWVAYPVLDLLVKFKCVGEFGAFSQWFYYPKSWLGFHAACQHIFQYPMYLVLIGMVFFGLAAMFSNT